MSLIDAYLPKAKTSGIAGCQMVPIMCNRVFSSQISRIMKWYKNLRLTAFKHEIWKLTKESGKWGCIAEASEYALPEWATRPQSEEEKKACRRAWELVSTTLPFPLKSNSTCQLIDLTRGS
jgi:hypothetical protein